MKMIRVRYLIIVIVMLGIAIAVFRNRDNGLIMTYADPVSLRRRASDQQAILERSSVFHGFRFSSAIKESGITFVSTPVTPAKGRRISHYDHGIGVAVADVDGDGFSDIYFISQIGGNELWRNKGDGTFENIMERSGATLPEKVSISASFADIDNDGDDDLYVTTVHTGNVLLENDGTGVFADITEKAGVGDIGHSSGAIFFDYNNDGLLDLLVPRIGEYTTNERGEDGAYVSGERQQDIHLYYELLEETRLFKNLGGNTFKEVSESIGLVNRRSSGDAGFMDFNSDGYPDVYILNMHGDDHFFENRGGRAFTDTTQRYFPKTPWGSMGIKVFDYNNNGLFDLFITDMHSDMFYSQEYEEENQKSDIVERGRPNDQFLQGTDNNIFGNAFYENTDAGFREVSAQLQLETYWPWGLSVGDVNADGYQDVFVSAGMGFPFRYQPNSLLLNDKGQGFLDSAFILGVESREEGEIILGHTALDCSGDDRKLSTCAGKTGTMLIPETASSRSSVMFDIEGDGDLDIITSEYTGAPQIFVNNLAQEANIHYLKIKLQGTRSNRNGLGATVTVSAGADRYTQYVDGKSGYLAQSQLPLYFGLGDHTAVDAVEIRWPSGVTQTVTEAIPLNGELTIREP